LKHESKLNTLFERDGEKKYALKLAYIGINYYGLEAQPGMPETIEYHIFNALEKLLLVKSRDDCGYSRAGRTDRGVSAFGNVISLKLRDGENWLTNLNKILPDDVINPDFQNFKIKILDICPVENSFNARYDCTKRIYKYFFYKENMDIDRMREVKKYCFIQAA
jgi:tRNA pseudouridine38/39 synthase